MALGALSTAGSPTGDMGVCPFSKKQWLTHPVCDSLKDNVKI